MWGEPLFSISASESSVLPDKIEGMVDGRIWMELLKFTPLPSPQFKAVSVLNCSRADMPDVCWGAGEH